MAKAKPVYGLDAQSETRYSLPAIFSARIAELWSFAPYLPDPRRVAELHDMRIASKRLRYCFEFFAPLLGKSFKPTLDTFKKLQDFLGEIHDCDVWVDYLRSELDDAYADLSAARKTLKPHIGASSELGRDARRMAELLDKGPLSGLLLMMQQVVERRAGLYNDLVLFWNELEQRDFRAELLQAVSRATLRPGPASQPRTEEAADLAAATGTEESTGLVEAQSGNNSGMLASEYPTEPPADADAAPDAPQSWPA